MSIQRQQSQVYQFRRMVVFFKGIPAAVQSSALDIRSQRLITSFIEFMEKYKHLEKSFYQRSNQQLETLKQVEDWYNFCTSRIISIKVQKIW